MAEGVFVCVCVNDKAAGPIFDDKKAKPKTFILCLIFGLKFNLDSIAGAIERNRYSTF